MPKAITKWKCNHCKKNFASKSYAERHERRCFFNFDNKACPTCNHFNGCFNPSISKCYKLDRYNKKKIVDYGFGIGEVEENEFNIFTEFCVYNCPDWDNSISDCEED